MSNYEAICLPTVDLDMDLERPILSIAVPKETATKASDVLVKYDEAVRALTKQGILTAVREGEKAAWTVDYRPIGNRRNQLHRLNDLRRLNYFARAVLNFMPLTEDTEEPITVSVGSYESINGTGRLGLGFDVRWPNTIDISLNTLATSVMWRAAKELGYMRGNGSRDRYRDAVYAQVSRQHGVTLETNPMGSCSVGTDGSYYSPDDSIIELTAHNIVGVDQQFICLAGAVAIARADELLQQQG